jgi:hypothetical protein
MVSHICDSMAHATLALSVNGALKVRYSRFHALTIEFAMRNFLFFIFFFRAC